MSENTHIWKMAFIALSVMVTVVTASSAFSTFDNNRTAITKAQIDTSPAAKEVTQARYLEAKALSDRAMFEQMAKAQK